MRDAGETAWLCECRWLLALVCLRASGLCVAWLWDSPSESGAAFLLVGVLALCPVGLSVLFSALAVVATASSTARRTLGSLQMAAAAAASASAAACRAAASALSARLCRRTVELIMIAGSEPVVAEELAALARWSPS